MKEFASIESFRHVIKTVHDYCKRKGKPTPTITYQGTVKLHGTNAGVRVTDSRVQPQGRTRILGIDSDNFGFAAFVHPRQELFNELTRFVTKKDKLKKDTDITFYGEWVGKGIQEGVALNQLEKHFVIFSAWFTRQTYFPARHFTQEMSAEFLKRLNDNGVFFINQVPEYLVTINFAHPEEVLEELERVTLAVEEECPWGKFRGVSGIGEGVVWVPSERLHEELSGDSGLWFKTKGLKHKNKGKKEGTNIPVAPEKVASIKEFVELVLPPWRLEQGISQLRQDGLEIDPKNTGKYLQWICKDVLKEETDRLTANNLIWKDVVGQLNRAARDYYLKETEKTLSA